VHQPSKKPKLDAGVFPSTSKRGLGLDQSAANKKVCRDSRSQNIDDEKTYEKDGLVHTFHGVTYQIKLILLFMKLGANKHYKFRIASERKGAEKFDDIEFEYDNDQGQRKNRMIQVKHKQDDGKKITLNDLMNVREGEFSLQKYFLSYRRLKQKPHENVKLENLVIFTNIDIDDKLQNDFHRLVDNDDILDLSNKRGKRLKLNADFSFKEDLVKTLKDTSELMLLIKKLDYCLKTGKRIDQKNELFKKYRIALSKHVIDCTSGKTKIRLDKNEIPLQLYDYLVKYEGEKVEVSESFGIGFDKDPQLSEKQSSALVKTISDAFSKNDIDPIKIPQNFRYIFKLAGHVFVEIDGKIKFRKGFFTDKSLPGNISYFKVKLLKVNYDLTSCWFDTNIPTYKEDDYENYKIDSDYFEKLITLPNDTISDDEIEDFLKILIFAVDQPNEEEMFGVIDQAISEGGCLNLEDTSFLRNELYKQIEEWMTKKQGSYLNIKHCEEMFNEVKQRVSKLELVAYKRSIYEEIKNYDVEFQEKLIVLRNFLESKEEKILNLVNSYSTLFSMIKLYHTLNGLVEYQKDDSFLLLRHEVMKSQDVTNCVLEAFKSGQHSNLLIMEIPTIAHQINEEMFRNFLEILRKTEKKKMVFVTMEAIQPPDASIKSVIFEDSDNKLTDLTIGSQNQIYENTYIVFQGQKLCLKELIQENRRNLIDEEVLLKIIKKEAIQIGEKIPVLGEVQNYYVARECKEIVFPSDLTVSQNRTTKFFMFHENSTGLENLKSDQEIILVSDQEEEFDKLCTSYATKNIHLFIEKQNEYIWQKSYGSIFNLREFHYSYCLERKHGVTLLADFFQTFIDMDNLFYSKNKVIIISAPPGMGKSTELTRFANNLKQTDPLLWILRINLVEYSKKISLSDFKIEICGKYLKDFFSTLHEGQKNEKMLSLEEKLFDSYYEQGKVVLLLDGFDEICPHYKSKVITFLRILKESKVKKLIVTTRSYGILSDLEDSLLTISHVFKRLKYNNQIKILVGIWSNQTKADKFDDEEQASLESKAHNLIESFRKNNLYSFLDNPLQLKMVAKTCQDLENYSLENFDLAKLYETFFNILFEDVFIQEKNPCIYKSKADPNSIDFIEEKREKFLDIHMHLALYSIFEKDVEKFLPKKFKNLTMYLDEINLGKYKIGIIEKIIDEKPIFVHRTFAEYFCALYLADEENWEKPGFRNYFREQLPQELMVRRFFVCLVTKHQNYTDENSLNVAFLQKNEVELKEYIENLDISRILLITQVFLLTNID
jgi:hypothetical protein